MRSLFLAATVALAAGGPAGAASLRYALSLAGVPLGSLGVDAETTGGGYRTDVAFHTAGLAGILDYAFEGTASGRQDPDHGLNPAVFAGQTRSPRALRHTRIEWAEGAVAFVAVDPPRKEAVDPGAATGALDPASALLRMAMPGTAGGVCGQSIDVYDGSRAIRLQFGAPTEEAGGIVCEAMYTRMGGEPLTPIDPPECPFEVHYRIAPDGVAVLETIHIPTRFGRATITRAG